MLHEFEFNISLEILLKTTGEIFVSRYNPIICTDIIVIFVFSVGGWDLEMSFFVYFSVVVINIVTLLIREE